MSDVQYDGGGFHGDGYAPWMSDVMVRRLAKVELEDLREQQAAEREREARTAEFTARSAAAAAYLAEQRGEWVSARDAAVGLVGRTHGEALAYMSAQMDLEDVAQRSRLRREGLADEEITQLLSTDSFAAAMADTERGRA